MESKDNKNEDKSESKKFKITKEHWQGAAAVAVVVVLAAAIWALTPGFWRASAPPSASAPEQEADSGRQEYLLFYNSGGRGVVEAYFVEEGGGSNGRIIPSGAPVYDNQVLFFSARPDEGWQVSSWWVNGEPIAGSGNIYIHSDINDNVDVSVHFEEMTD